MVKRTFFVLILCVLVAVLAGCGAARSFSRGESYAKKGEWDLAVKEYRDANRAKPDDIEYRSALLRAQETAGTQHYLKARNYLKEQKIEQAIVELQQAIFLNPSNLAIQSTLKTTLGLKEAEERYRAALTFQELGRINDAINEMTAAVNLAPESVKYTDFLSKLHKKKHEHEPEDALTLASDKPITLNFKNTNIKDVFDFLSKTSGINIMFDDEVKTQPVTIFVKDVSFQYALNLLLSTHKLFMKKVSGDTIIIIPKSKGKIDQYQDLVVKTFYINNAKSKEIVNLIRTMLDVKKVYVNEPLNSITVRESPEKMKLVEKIIAANDLKEGEVILDVEILEISRTNTLKFGWNFTPALSATGTLQSVGGSTNTYGLTLGELTHLTRDNFYFAIPGIVVNLIKSDSDAQTLANPRVRVMNNKQAKFHIGDKIPIQTSTVTSTSTTAVTSTFEYKDIGIKLTIEPIIHLNNNVTLKLSMEVSTLGDALDFGNSQKQYKFGTRNTETLINLRDGETVIIGGLIKDEDRKTKVKVPLLGEIPAVGRLFSSTDDEIVKTDILMSITPNIVRNMELPARENLAFWSGTEEAYDTKPLFVSSETKSSKTTPKKQLDKDTILDSMAKAGALEQAKSSKIESSPTVTSQPAIIAPVAVGRPQTAMPGAAAASSPAGQSVVAQSGLASKNTTSAIVSGMTHSIPAAGQRTIISAPQPTPQLSSRLTATGQSPILQPALATQNAGQSISVASSTTPSKGQIVPATGISVLSAPTSSIAEQQTSNPILEITPPDVSTQIGQEMRFELTAGSMKNLYGAIITLTYDPKALEFKTASEGVLLKKDGQQTSFLYANNVKAGTLDIYVTRIANVGGIDGSGSLCTLTFQGKAGSTSDLSVRNAKLTNLKREQIQCDIKGAKVTVK